MQFAVTVERLIAAPRPKLYRAWLDPSMLARWMGPDGFSVVLATVDERIGGAHQIEMLDADGAHHTFVSVIEELVPDERIVFAFRFAPQAPATRLTVTFADADGGGTMLRLDHEDITVDDGLDTRSVDVGWSQALTKLQRFVEAADHPAHAPE
jgi:uncharacterized protein YndB with AHSA1/START domain